jgi:hypothetical protein
MRGDRFASTLGLHVSQRLSQRWKSILGLHVSHVAPTIGERLEQLAVELTPATVLTKVEGERLLSVIERASTAAKRQLTWVAFPFKLIRLLSR